MPRDAPVTRATFPLRVIATRSCTDPRLVADLHRGAELAEHGDGREVGELTGARVLRGHVFDLDAEAPELAFHRDAVLVALLPGDSEDLDAGLLGTNAGERHGGDDVDVGGEGFDRLRGRSLEDERLFLDGVEVDLLLLDPWRAGESPRRLAGLHDHGRDGGLARPLHAVEAGDG